MKCRACDDVLTDFEATRKSALDLSYLDLCNKCFFFISSDLTVIEREDLRGFDETIEENWEDGYV